MKTLDVDLEYLLQKSGKEIFLKNPFNRIN